MLRNILIGVVFAVLLALVLIVIGGPGLTFIGLFCLVLIGILILVAVTGLLLDIAERKIDKREAEIAAEIDDSALEDDLDKRWALVFLDEQKEWHRG